MNPEFQTPTWWELHLRHARGEELTEAERQAYEAELARHDQGAPPLGDLESLRQLRQAASQQARENAQLRERLEQLEGEVRAAEQALSRRTQELLGVSE